MSDIFGLAATRLKSELQQGAEVTPPNANDLEAAARRMRQENDAARLRQTAIETQGSNPDTAARAQRLGRDMGLPPAVVERNLPEVERQAELERLNGLSYDDYLANYLADPDNYRVARDDVNMLEEMSKAARAVGNVARAVPGGAVGGAGSAISGAGSWWDAVTRNYVGRPIDAALGALGLGRLQDYNTEIPWWMEPANILRRGGGAIKEIGRAIDPPQAEQNIATDIAGGVGQLATQIAVAIYTGGAATLPMLLAQGADQQAERLERQGKYGTPEGDAAIVAGAAVTALTEKYGLDFIMRKLPQAARDGIMRRLQDVAVSAGAEALQEVVEGILQNVVEYAYYNPDAEILQDFSREAIAAGGAAAVVRSVLLAASGGRASAQRRQDSERAQQDSEALKRVNELAEQSKLRERNPDKFREFVRGLVEPERAVEIDAETAVELFQSEPDLTQFMTQDEAERVSREVTLAREVGSDVRMPLSTFIGAFVGHPQFDTLAENVRLSDNAPTAREASMTPEDLERQVGLLREEVGTVARQQEVTRQIYDDIFAQLKAAAVDDLSSTKYAAIFTARLRTRAERLGQDPLELYRQSRPEIRRKYDGPRLRLSRLGTPAEPEYVSPVMPSGLKRVLEDARKGVKLRQRSMSSFFARMGGIKDQGGELMAIMGTYRAMPGLVNNKTGRTLDRALETAVEEGYMPYGSTIAEFLDVLSDDVNKRAQNFGWSEDFEGKARQEAVDDLVNELDALGLTIRDSDAAIAQALGIEPEMASATLEDLEALDRMRFRGAEPAPLGPVEDPNARTLDQGAFPDTLEVDGVLRPTANSEGRPIHPTEEGVRNFWRWFGDSKVVDDQGRPLVVYRGGPAQDWKTGEQITEFQSRNGPWAGFFSSSKDVASRFASVLSGSVVTPTFVSISNPLEVDANGAPARDFQIDASAIEKADSPIRRQFLDGNYDGLILRNTADEGDVFVPRESEQVKSAIGNTGAFSRDDGRILEQRQQEQFGDGAAFVDDFDLPPDVSESVRVSLRYVKGNTVELVSITTDRGQRGMGFGNRAMNALTSAADSNGIRLVLSAAEDADGSYGGLAYDDLVGWYERFDFEMRGDSSRMVRDPQSRALEQTDPRNLVVLHNLKPEAVLHANKMGGLPIPSVAVANKDQGFGGFGSISLVGSPSLVDPKQDKAAKVFDADVYSPRYPTVTYDIDFKALRAIEGDLKALAERLGREFYDGDIQEKGGRAIREAVVWKARFLEERGALPDPVLRTDGKVDRWKTEEAIEAAVKPLDAEFSDWAESQEKKLIKKEKIFDGFTPMGSRRYLPHNLDVVVRLLKKDLRGGENFNYGVGSIRAHHAKQFKSLKEIQAKRGNLVSSEAMKAVKKELNDDFTKLADSLKNNYKFKVGFGYYDDFSAALGEMVKRGRAPLNEAFNDLSQEQLADINAFITKLRNAPTEYFEAKIQRVVKLNEFVGAIVPRYGVSDKVIAALEANGLKIVRYDTAQERTAALGEFQNEFFQRQETGPRGSIQFLPDGQTIINLTEKADLSTFLHEMSHAWLEEMKADARLPDAPAQIVEDWNRIAAYLGIDPNVDFIPTEAHETFARTGEAYFMEGKAPSLELASAFERFKAWMVRIYRTIAGLNVPINDEIRGVFDRMLAADDEIEAAKNQFKFEGLFALAKDAGMTEDEFRRYQDLAAKARLEAEQKVLAMLQAEERRAQREEYREARETITAEVEAQVKGEPVYQTIVMLARGEMPDGTTLDTPMKLDRAMVRASYGTSIGKRLPRGVMADNGVPPDLVAPMFGFTSGDEMIKAMEAAPPLQQEIRRRVQERLKAQFPNPVDDGRAAEEAIEALHNDAQMQVLEAEFKALQRLGAGKLVDAAVRRSGGQGQQAGQAMGPEARAEAALGAQRRAAEGKAARDRVKVTVDSLRADRKAIERAADAVINDTTVNDLLNTQKWRRAERASANAVIDAVAGQDWPAAAWHQRQRIINAHMVRRSMEARKDIEKAIGRFDKYLSKKPGPIDPDYLEKVRTILSAYQFGPQLSDRRRNLLELRAILDWQKALSEDEQARLDIPPEITAASEKTHYRDMTVGEFMALRDTVENLATVGRTKNRLLREQAERDLNKTAELVAETILNNVKTVARRSKDAIEKRTGYSAGRLKDEIFASHRKMESLLREFDGFKKLGPVWQALFKPLQDAQNTETRMSIEAAEAIKKLFESYPADARRTWRTKITYYPEVRQSLSKATVMSIALNWGNEGNREAIRQGYKWSDDEVRAVLNQTLTESDWQFVQGVWDYIDSFWPQLAALEKRVKGIEPVKVEASPVRTPFGEFRGGYYPLKYDSELSERAFSFQVDKMAQNLMTGQVAKASTRTGAALERVGSGGMPVRLELDVMFEHVAEVIHDLSHREAILDVMRLLEHPEVRGAVLETKGPEFHSVMKNWVRDIAAGDVPALTWFDKVVQHLRSGMSIAAMGWKLTTALVQVTGFVQSAVMLPKGALLKSVTGFYSNPLAWRRKADFVFDRSVEMRTRSKNLDRDIRDSLRKLGPEGKADALKRSFFYMTGLMDMGVAIPTWLAAYETGMDQFQGDEAKAIDYADQVVRTTQSSGLQKDLASIQRGGPLMKMYTAFYSYFSATYNLMVEQHRGMKRVRDMPKFVANMALLTFVPAVLSEVLLGRGPDEDEDESWWFWSGKTTLKYLLGAFVGVRDFGNAVLGSGAGYAGSPVGSAIESMVKLTKQIQQGEADRGLARAAFDTAGPVLHLPSRQAWITAEGIYLWSEGHEITPFEIFVTRDPKKFR